MAVSKSDSYFVEFYFNFFRINIKKNVATSERISVMSAYDTAPVVPMTAPVTRFSLKIPVVPVIIIASDAREIDTVIARRNPTANIFY